MTISRWILLKMKNASYKSCTENQNTHFTFSTFSENRIVYEIMSKNLVQPEKPQATWCMRVACSISKATRAKAHARAHAPTPTATHTHTHSRTQKYVIYSFSMATRGFIKAPQYNIYSYVAPSSSVLLSKKIHFQFLCHFLKVSVLLYKQNKFPSYCIALPFSWEGNKSLASKLQKLLLTHTNRNLT
jgi:hypothetical protein